MLFSDNEAAVKLTQNAVYHSQTKHIDLKAHHIRDLNSKGDVAVRHVRGVDNPADILTKPLPPELHQKCVALLGLA